MPVIDIDHVVSCSSADKNNPAENLLKGDRTHKWKCAAAGEKRVCVVLQLKKSSEITSIDIGNEGSAFVEVLVGKATAAIDEDFEVLLVASAFMSPIESRNGTNKNSVRMFGPDKLNKQVADKKWDRVKIVCTQPFSKLHAYGLSFFKLHSSSSGSEGEVNKGKKLGAFTIKDSDEDDIQIGSLFANRSKLDTPAAPKGAAAVRAATKLAEEHSLTSPTPALSSPSSSFLSSNESSNSNHRKRPSSPSLVYENNLKVKAAKHSQDDNLGEDEKVDKFPARTELKKQASSVSSATSSSSSSLKEEKTPLRKNKTESARSSPSMVFSKLMRKVIFVLSGFQNPHRGELRDQALEMGAKYRPDWGPGCTHLVCAFANTPKYQQVSGKGKIVTKKWIQDCYNHKKILPWRKYRLGDAESPDESSTEEEEEYRPAQKTSTLPLSNSKASKDPTPKPLPSKSPAPSKQTKKKGVQYFEESDSGGDTEDELRKINNTKNSLKPKASASPNTLIQASADPYSNSTDEENDERMPTNKPSPDNHEDEEDAGFDSGLPDLPDFFTDKHFFFYGSFEDGEQRLLTRYIAAFNGEIEDYMSSKVNFVITSQKWDDNFETALNDNPGLIFVTPKWILACQKKGSLTPYQPYIVVP